MVIEGDAVPQHFIPQLISLYERGLSPFDKLIQSYDLDRINTAFNDSDSGRAIKPVIVYRPRGRTLAAPARGSGLQLSYVQARTVSSRRRHSHCRPRCSTGPSGSLA